MLTITAKEVSDICEEYHFKKHSFTEYIDKVRKGILDAAHSGASSYTISLSALDENECDFTKQLFIKNGFKFEYGSSPNYGYLKW